MSGGLLAIAQDRHAAGIFARQRGGSYGAGRSRSDSRDLAGIDDANWRTAVGIEENDEALVRL